MTKRGDRDSGSKHEPNRSGLADEARLGLGVEEVRRLPLHSEAARAVVRQVEQGEVHIHKRVRTELRQLSIPVRIEELVVERKEPGRRQQGDFTAAASSSPLGEAFVEGEVRVQLWEERAEVKVEPVVRELVIIRKSVIEESSRHEVSLRHEHATVESTGSAEWTDEGEDPEGTRH